ncbi:hypothetical protein GNP93_21175 [Paenibacillus validus]|uniref:Uncharacterized protein n=2 Tax=Paenibacillus TaxID=44249 RepID=A0A7X2ZE10_9BACL|nr:hypothetical protein [Paenibacillus validus]
MLLACSLMLPAFLSAALPAHAAPLNLPTDIKVQINDSLVHFPDAQPLLDGNSKLHVPARTIAEKLGYKLTWQQEGSQIHVAISSGDTTLSVTTGEQVISVNNQTASIEHPVKMVNGRVYVPFRLLAETFGKTTQWDANNRIAILGTDGKYHAPAWYRPKTIAKNYVKVIEAKATAYTAAPSENGGYGSLDYMGNTLKLGTIAVDPNIIPLGSKVYIEGYNYAGLPTGGMYATATDVGGAIKGNKIDIFVPESPSQASRFGIQQVKVYVLGS